MNVSAEALRERFAVRGRFYESNLGGRTFQLRSHLEIFERSLAWPQVADGQADLVAVMMNPGGSRPLEAIDRHGWARALPDRTQYQLMKLALLAQDAGHAIRHIRVVNLSDLRTPKSAELFATLASLGDDRHSIFSAQRAGELQKALGSAAGSLLLRAWGLARQLHPMASTAVEKTSQCRVLGLTDDGLSYRHPLPQQADLQRRWLQEMAEQVTASL